jgi:hypothetical protein
MSFRTPFALVYRLDRTTEDGNKWIWTAIEETTRWPLARGVKDATAQTAVRRNFGELCRASRSDHGSWPELSVTRAKRVYGFS